MSADRIVPFAIENPQGRGSVVIVVDHASNHVPERWEGLGLGPAELAEHIAWDPGALPVAREMSRLLDAPLIAGTVSRLVVDLNRPVGSPTIAPAVSESTPVPGNAAIADADMAERIAAIYEPYHAALDELVEAKIRRAAVEGTGPVAVVAVHTFTPVYRGVPRPLHAGILFGADDRLGRGMLDALGAEPGLVVAANEPYSPADEVYYTLERHALSRGLFNVMIEIRNDEVRTAEAQRRWAHRLTDAISRTMARVDREDRVRRKAGSREG